MDVSELRKRILRALDDARQEAATRRVAVDEAGKAYAHFLDNIAVPLMRQAATVLNGSGHPFVLHTPAGSVKLAAEASPMTFLEFELDSSREHPEIIGRLSLARGRQAVVLDERALAPHKDIDKITEEEVSAFLVAGIPKLLVRS
jgi:hypothetical protein